MQPDSPRPQPRLEIDGHDVAPAEIADKRAQRRRGLLGRSGVEGVLWLPGARQVHTFGMSFPIDVAHLDRDGRVLAVTTMPPGRLGALRWRSRGVLESEAGRMATWGLAPGVVVTLRR